MAQPMVIALFALMGFNLADTWFVAQLGARELAAMSFTFPVVSAVTSIGIGLMAGTSSVLARRIGAGDDRQVRRMTCDALVLAALVALALAVLGLRTIDPVFRALGAPPDVLPLIRDYMTIWYASLILLLPSMAAVGAIRATGDSAGQSLMLVCASLVNLALDPLLIFGLAGLPRLEIEGAALASVIARGVAIVPAYYLLHVRHDLLRIARPSYQEFVASLRAVAAVAGPAAGTNAIIPLAAGVVTALIAGHGAAAVAGYGAGWRVEGMSLILFYALSAVVGPIVGQNLGAGLGQRSHQAVRSSMRFCLLSGVVVAAALWPAAPWLASWFSDDAQVTAITVSYLRIVPISFGAEGLVMVVNAAFNAAGRPLTATWISVTRVFLMQIPLAVIGAHLAGVTGIFVGLLAGNMLAAVVAAARWQAHAHRAALI